MASLVHIGTSGFAFRDWLGTFYPADTPPEDLLAVYAQRLGAVELNATFHRLPPLSSARTWTRAVSPDFRICLKAPRRLTHDPKLVRAAATITALRTFVAALGQRAGPVLVQLPPVVPADTGLLDHFLSGLAGVRIAVELRHPSWRSDATLRVLSRHAAGLVLRDTGAGLPPLDVTGDFSYWRLRRTTEERDLDEWAERAALLAGRGIEVFAFIRQDRSGQAARRAEALRRRVDADLERLHGDVPRRREERGHAAEETEDQEDLHRTAFEGPGEQIVPRGH